MKNSFLLIRIVCLCLWFSIIAAYVSAENPGWMLNDRHIKALADRLKPDPKSPLIPVAGFWKDGTLYLSHEDYVRFENLRQTSSYPVKEFER